MVSTDRKMDAFMATRAPRQKKNIIVLLVDSARAKDVYSDSALSTMRSVMKNGTVYRNVIAPGTWTGAVHASLFANKRISDIPYVSQNFFQNGSEIDPWMVKTKFLPENQETVASKLSSMGYITNLVSNNPFLSSFTNLALGFDNIFDVWRDSNIKYNRGIVKRFSRIIEGGASARQKMYRVSNAFTSMLPQPIFDRLYLYLRIKLDRKIASVDGTSKLDRGASDTNRVIKGALDGYSGAPNFMFVNLMEAHENYPTDDSQIIPDKWLYLSGIKELDDYVARKMHAGYIDRLRYLDRQLSKTIAIMREAGYLDNANLIITSDHGQFFGEHGLLYHSMFPYEEVVKVPLMSVNYQDGKIVKQHEEIGTPVNLMSLHDAILSIASGKEDRLNGNMRSTPYVVSEHTGIIEGWDESLLRMLKNRSKYASMIYAAKERFNEKATAVYCGDFKMIRFARRNKIELYDIAQDPAESDNIIAHARPEAKRMARFCC
jgi:arylsulfatase A-like enzyme